MSNVYDDIRAERERQDAQWGGPSHDAEHDCHDWRSYRERQEKRVVELLDSPHPAVYEPADARKRLVKIAALAVAQIEALDRT